MRRRDLEVTMTMLMRFDPLREFDRVFDQAWSQTRQASVPMDAYRHGDSFVVRLDLPGVDPSSIDVGVEQNVLTVAAERSWQPAEGDEVIANERRQGRFTRQLFLGDALDADRITASYDNGVLTLTIPVHEKAKPRKIEVSGNTGEPAAIDTTSA
jgi:HSP20 family protein